MDLSVCADGGLSFKNMGAVVGVGRIKAYMCCITRLRFVENGITV